MQPQRLSEQLLKNNVVSIKFWVWKWSQEIFQTVTQKNEEFKHILEVLIDDFFSNAL